MDTEQNIWEISLLGVPRAHQGSLQAHLRSRETWGVVASLVLPAALGRSTMEGVVAVSRNNLAERFWSDARDPRHSLRQAICSIRTSFGEDFISSDHHNVSAAAAYVTDIERIRTLYRRATECTEDSDRLELLAEAETLIHGSFLEGCVDTGESAYQWYLASKTSVDGLVLEVLACFGRLQESMGDINGAFDTTHRMLQYNPDDAGLIGRLWELGRRTNRPQLEEVIASSDLFEDALPRIKSRAKKGLPLSIRETRIFEHTFQDRLAGLKKRTRQHVLSLSVLNGPFTAEFAQRVCSTPASILNELADTQFLERTGKIFEFLPAVRTCALRLLPPKSRSSLEGRLFAACLEALKRYTNGECWHGIEAIEPAVPLLEAALELTRSGQVTAEAIYYVKCLRHCGLTALADRAIGWLESALDPGSPDVTIAYLAATCLGDLHSASHRFTEAVTCYERALEIAVSVGRPNEVANAHGQLSVALHHAEFSELALDHNEQQRKLWIELFGQQSVASCLRFRGEILTALRDYTGVLIALDEAEQIYRKLGNLPLGIAECRSWAAEALTKLGRFDEALDAAEESLGLRMDAEDWTGVGQCLNIIGAVRAQQGRYSEARAHVLHAIHLFEREGKMPSRAASLATLGDVYVRQNRVAEARTCYEEGLAFWQENGHERWSTVFKQRLEACVSRNLLDQ